MATSSGTADNNTTSACGCTNITIMQLFHELKQKFPAVPDRVVSDCIKQNYHNKETCEWLLHRENQAYLMHSYPLALKMSAAASESSSPLSTKFHGLSICDNPPVSLPSVYNQEQSRLEETPLTQPQILLPAGSSGPLFPPHPNERSPSLQQCDKSRELPGDNSSNQGNPFVYDNSRGLTSLQSQIPPNFFPSQQFLFPQCFDNLVPFFENGDNRRQTHHWNYNIMNSQYLARSNVPQQLILQERENGILSQHCNNNNNHNGRSHECRGCSLCLSHKNVQHNISSTSSSIITSSSASSSTNNHKQLSRPCSLDVPQRNPHSVANTPRSAPVMCAPFDSFAHTSEFRSNVNPSNPAHGSHQEVPNTSNPFFRSNVFQDDVRAQPNDSNYRGSGTVLDNYEVNVSCSVQRSPVGSTAGITDGGPPRVKSSIEVNPAPHYAGRGYFPGINEPWKTSVRPQQARSYTSVNLTLRPPSSEPQEPIDIRSSGSTLTYSTSSYDPRQGFQSQVQIRIGPGGGGSVSAVRTRTQDSTDANPPLTRPVSCYGPLIEEETPVATPPTRSESLPDFSTLSSQVTEISEDSLSSQEDSLSTQLIAIGGDKLDPPTQALLIRQIERKNKLKRELKKEKEKLRAMQREIHIMKEDLERRKLLKQRTASLALPVVTSVLQKVHQLRQEILRLQEECKKMTNEVDLSFDARVPLGETDEEFYKHIYTGQRGSILPTRTSRHRRQAQARRESPQESSEGPNWTCTECTFHNHPLLDKCEQCEMPRIVLGTTTRPRLSLPAMTGCYCHQDSEKPPTTTTDEPKPITPAPMNHVISLPNLTNGILTNAEQC